MVSAIAVGVPGGAVGGRAAIVGMPAIARPLETVGAKAGRDRRGTSVEVLPFSFAEKSVVRPGFQREPRHVSLHVHPRDLDDRILARRDGSTQALTLAGQDTKLPVAEADLGFAVGEPVRQDHAAQVRLSASVPPCGAPLKGSPGHRNHFRTVRAIPESPTSRLVGLASPDVRDRRRRREEGHHHRQQDQAVRAHRAGHRSERMTKSSLGA
jgi:hypothetical protein